MPFLSGALLSFATDRERHCASNVICPAGRTTAILGAAAALALSLAAALHTVAPTHQFHLGLWFNSPARPFHLGCEGSATSPIVTPFDGEQYAGTQILNTTNFKGKGAPLARQGLTPGREDGHSRQCGPGWPSSRLVQAPVRGSASACGPVPARGSLPACLCFPPMRLLA